MTNIQLHILLHFAVDMKKVVRVYTRTTFHILRHLESKFPVSVLAFFQRNGEI